MASTFCEYLKQYVLITSLLYRDYLSDRCCKEALLTNIEIRIVPCAYVELSADRQVVGIAAVVAHGSDNHFSDSLANLAIADFAKLADTLLKKLRDQIYLVFSCRKHHTFPLATHNVPSLVYKYILLILITIFPSSARPQLPGS